MKKITNILRIILAAIYFVFGLNGFLNFIPQPASIPEAAMAFGSALMKTGYFLPFLKATEVLAGLLLLSGFATPLALAILAPITINIFLFHFFLTPGEWVMGAGMVLIHLFLAWQYRKAFSALMTSKIS